VGAQLRTKDWHGQRLVLLHTADACIFPGPRSPLNRFFKRELANFLPLLLHIADACIFPGPKQQKLLHLSHSSQQLRHLWLAHDRSEFNQIFNASNQNSLEIAFIAGSYITFPVFVANRTTLVFLSVPVSDLKAGSKSSSDCQRLCPPEVPNKYYLQYALFPNSRSPWLCRLATPHSAHIIWKYQ
jgi:hypothetical protein